MTLRPGALALTVLALGLGADRRMRRRSSRAGRAGRIGHAGRQRPRPPAPSGSARALPAPSGGAAAGAAPSAAPISLSPKGLIEAATPSRLYPDLQSERGLVAREDGDRRYLVDRMRVTVHDDGSIERATERLPPGSITSVALPSRLGGGFLFHANNAGGTQIWRAPGWLAKLVPLAQLSTVASDIIPGFDRLYIRFQNNSRMSALSPETGELLPLGPLPLAASYGQLAFADGWRAVVDTDLRGPLTTFDAGGTWRPVGVSERATAVGIVNGDPTVMTSAGRYQIDARGLVTFRSDGPREVDALLAELAASSRAPGPLGKRPLRAALEDGWPDSPTSAVVARGGSLARVSLENGAVLAHNDEAYPDRRAPCHAIRLGKGFGFVCGERDADTAVYDFVPPLGMRPILRFSRPRFVAASGNGALVIRGKCSDDGAADGEARSYCVRNAEGGLREIRVKGDLGVERVVALSDGRVAVLIPPRSGSPGQITLLDGSAASSVALKLPEGPKSVVRELGRGMWLDGFEERDKGVLSGWVEAGGPVIGVRIALDGKVTAGPLRDDNGGALLSGRFGLSFGDSGHAAETTDGGQHWEVFDLPERDDETRSGTSTRGCGPAGCVLGGWLRVGWGKPAVADDLRPVDSPSAPYLPLKVAQTLWFSCELSPSASASSGPAGKATAPAKPPPPRPGARPGLHGAGPVGPVTPAGWLAFRGVPGPTLANDDIGFDHGPYADTVMLRAYAWGKRGADWTRNGHWLVRFDDRFDPSGAVRSSAVTAALWPDENAAAEAVGNGGYGSGNWAAFLDPSGTAALATFCRGSGCAFYSVADGQPVLPIRDASGRARTPATVSPAARPPRRDLVLPHPGLLLRHRAPPPPRSPGGLRDAAHLLPAEPVRRSILLAFVRPRRRASAARRERAPTWESGWAAGSRLSISSPRPRRGHARAPRLRRWCSELHRRSKTAGVLESARHRRRRAAQRRWICAWTRWSCAGDGPGRVHRQALPGSTGWRGRGHAGDAAPAPEDHLASADEDLAGSPPKSSTERGNGKALAPPVPLQEAAIARRARWMRREREVPSIPRLSKPPLPVPAPNPEREGAAGTGAEREPNGIADVPIRGP
ncbi:MAG: hypothetical protein U0359_29425 [Byssovorax sp.]